MYLLFILFITEYGLPEESELKVQANIIASTLITIRLDYDGKIATKKIPPTMLVQKLITLVQKIFKLQDRPVLKRVSRTDKEIVVDLDDEMKELGYYSVQDGDNVIVQTNS